MSPKHRSHTVLTALAIATALFAQSCKVVGGIFKAGVWVGVVALVMVLAIVGGAVALFRKS